MKKIADGTCRAVRCDASGYVYGHYAHRPDYPNIHFIKEPGQDIWITPIKVGTLVLRQKGKWKKMEMR